jgi:Domain of unknown function (DUF2760)
MVLLVVAFVVSVLAGISWYEPALIPFDLRFILATLGAYLFVEGVLSLLRSKKAAESERTLLNQYNNAYSDFLQVKEELDQLSGVFREVKERELSLQSALTTLKEEYDDDQRSGQLSLPMYSDVMTLLSLFQTKGRFIDFLSQDITSYGDEHVGRVARFVHQGCSEVMKEHIDVEPIFTGHEGESITLSGDFEARAYRLVGKVKDRPPYRGTITHKGWRVKRISIPRIVGDEESEPERSSAAILAPAEVEVAS